MDRLYTQAEVSKIAQELLDIIYSVSKPHAVLVCLSGDLGAGKTTLVQEIARCLEIKEDVISPTYTLMKSYPIHSNSIFKKLIHIDAYRIESNEEFSRLGWDEIISDPENLIFLEWPEKVSGSIGNPSLYVTLTHHNNDSRKMTLVRYTE